MRGLLAEAGGGLLGLGVGATVGERARLEVRGSALVANLQAGLVVSRPGALARIDRSVIAAQESGGAPGEPLVQGVVVEAGGRLELSESAVIDNHGVGLYVWSSQEDAARSSASVLRSVVRGNGPRPSSTDAGRDGAGILAGGGSSVEIGSSSLVENTSVGLLCDDGCAGTIADSVVRASRVNREGAFGRGIRGINVQGPSRLTMERTAVVDNHEVGLFIADPEARVGATGLLVMHTRPDGTGRGGSGVEVVGGVLDLTDSAVLDSHDLGVHLNGPTAQGRLTRTLVRGVAPRAGAWGGRGPREGAS